MLSAEVVEAARTGLLPAACMTVATLVIRRMPGRSQAVAAVLGVVGSYLSAHWLIGGAPGLWPKEAIHWTPYLGALAVLPCALERRGKGVRQVVWIALAGAVVWSLLGPLTQHYWSGLEAAFWFSGTALVLLALWHPLLRETTATRPATLAALAVLAGGIGGASLLSHSARYAQLGIALATVLAVASALQFHRPRAAITGGAAHAAALLVAAHLVAAHHYVELSLGVTLCLVLAWLTSHVPSFLPAVSRWPGRKVLWVSALLAALPTAAALCLGWLERSRAGGMYS